VSKKPSPSAHEFLVQVIEGLQPYDDEHRLRFLRTIMTYYNLGSLGAASNVMPTTSSDDVRSATTGHFVSRRPIFSDHAEMTAKEFLQQKAPRTDIERVACLAYYLTHYLDIRHFKTLEINKLNTDAAQPKFSNTSYAVENALRQGLLVPAIKGMKQLSADGEAFVDALPDREAAKNVRANFRRRRSKKRKGKSKRVRK
jgi:hypothetical protein